MAKTKSFGAAVYLNGIAVGGLTDITASGTEVSFVDTTEHDGGTAATGSITFTGLSLADETVVVNGETYTFKASAGSATEITIGATAAITAANTAAKIAANDSDVHAYGSTNGMVVLTATTRGTAGNDYTLTESATNTTVSGAGTFTGGAAQANGGFKTFLSGLKDGGTLELTGKYDYGDAGQAEWKAEEGVAHVFYIVLPDKSGFALTAIVGGFQTSNPLDDAVEFSATAKITGPVYPLFPTVTVTGTLTSDGSAPVTFAAFTLGSISDDRMGYTATDGTITRSGGSWILTDTATSAAWSTTNDALTPTAATGWAAVNPATGTPTLTGS